MNRRALIAILFCVVGRAWAETEISAPEAGDARQETTSDLEWEAKGIIPSGGLAVSTQPVTPISLLPERVPYDQALQELALALDLWKKGKAEAASDISLESYDDLMTLSLSRRNKKKRQKLRLDRRQAATVYIDSSIAYIEEYVRKNGGTPKVLEEARARLTDLHDVSQNYPELNKKLHKALDSYSPPAPAVAPVVTPSTVPVTAPAVQPSSPTVKS